MRDFVPHDTFFFALEELCSSRAKKNESAGAGTAPRPTSKVFDAALTWQPAQHLKRIQASYQLTCSDAVSAGSATSATSPAHRWRISSQVASSSSSVPVASNRPSLSTTIWSARRSAARRCETARTVAEGRRLNDEG